MSAKKDQAKKAEATKATTPETAPAKEKAAKAPKAKADPTPKKMSALDAAAKVLGEQGKPMACHELIEEMSRKNYWTSPNGCDPAGHVVRSNGARGKDQGQGCPVREDGAGQFRGQRLKGGVHA
jgi:hypothetical protein